MDTQPTYRTPKLRATVMTNFSHFYAIGNTPPRYFGPEIPLEFPRKDILLLGCGDPRSVLHTLWMDEGLCARKSQTFTMVDQEPAIFSRNLILLFLLANPDLNEKDSSVYWTDVWAIWSNLFLSEKQLKMVNKAALAIIAHFESKKSDVVDRKDSNESLQIFEMCTVSTERMVLGVLKKYSECSRLQDGKTTISAKKFSAEIAELQSKIVGGFVFSGSRRQYTSSYFTRFWKKGSVQSSESKQGLKKHPNPLFALTSLDATLRLHYGSNPLDGFHLALGYVALDADEENFPNLRGKVDSAVKASQFELRRWGENFAKLAKNAENGLKIYICVADAVDFALLMGSQPGNIDSLQYPTGLSLEPLQLKETYHTQLHAEVAPSRFDVIDTSNLADHVGLLNLLLCCADIIKPYSSSTIHTDSLVSFGTKNMTFKDVLQAKLNMDPALISSFLGLSLVANLLPWTATPNMFDSIMHKVDVGSKKQQRLVSLSWKPTLQYDEACSRSLVKNPTKMTMKPTDFAKLFGYIFYKMFEIMHPLSGVLQTMEKAQNFAFMLQNSESFAILLKKVLLNLNLESNSVARLAWEELEFSTGPKIPMFFHFIREILIKLHQLNVHSDNRMFLNFRSTLSTSASVRLVLLVPLPVCEKTFGILPGKAFYSEKLHLPTPEIVICVGSNSDSETLYQTVDCGFVERFPSSQLTEIHDDRYGLKCENFTLIPVRESYTVENTFLAVSAVVFGGDLVGDPVIALRLLPTSRSTMMVMQNQEVNFLLELFTAKLSNRSLVSIARAELRPISSMQQHDLRPVKEQELPMRRSPFCLNSISEAPKKGESGNITINVDKYLMLSTFEVRVSVEEPDELKQLQDSKNVAKLDQISLCVLDVVFGTCHIPITFPVPVDYQNANLKFSRRSAFVDIKVPPLRFCRNDMTMAPLSRQFVHGKWILNLKGILRSPIEKLPLLDSVKNADWISNVAGMQFSPDDKIRLRPDGKNATNVPKPTAFQKLKDSIHQIVILATKNASSRYFALALEKEVKIFIYLVGIRLDINNFGIILDTLICPLTMENVTDVAPLYLQKSGDNVIHILMDGEDELQLWKELLPTFVESVRTTKGYVHSSKCLYSKSIPVSTENGKNPVCNCGKGKMIDEKMEEKVGGKFAAKQYYRAGINLFSSQELDIPNVAPNAEPNERKKTPESKFTGGKSEKAVISCEECGKANAKVQICSRCKKVSYCNPECQKKNWPKHKTICKSDG